MSSTDILVGRLIVYISTFQSQHFVAYRLHYVSKTMIGTAIYIATSSVTQNIVVTYVV